MKKSLGFLLLVLFAISPGESSYVGKVYFKPRPGGAPLKIFSVPKSFLASLPAGVHSFGKDAPRSSVERAEDGALFEDQLTRLHSYFESEIIKGNLRLRLIQDDALALMEHRRYSQYYKDLEVFGGEIVEHFKDGQLVGINGRYYEIGELYATPVVERETAVSLLAADLGKPNLVERADLYKLVIYPLRDGEYRVAHYLVLREKPGNGMTGIVDARTGEIHLKYHNVKRDDLTIGTGYGCHGETYKFPVTFQDGRYLLADESRARPVGQSTHDFRTSDGRYYYLAWDADNFWSHDGALVSVHALLGLTYDYYYLFLGRKGIDNKNMDILATVHWTDGRDNAFWDGDEKRIYFLDPGQKGCQFAAALDAVAHEYSHGVTDYTSGLIYLYDSGALNESFSDIMGTAVEFYWQEPGSGFLRADWTCGEDARPYFSGAGLRHLADPNSHSQFGDPDRPDPCHVSQLYDLPWHVDNGGVHVNSTLYSHAYYLLAQGGTNKVSGKSVAGIGIEKATKIFYRAWTCYMGSSTDFWTAANILVQSAADIYGLSSDERTQTSRAMEAIGW